MLETLYKTSTPEASLLEGEFYELVLDDENDSIVVKEIHGWWDAKHSEPIHQQVTLSPDEGYQDFEEALERYELQRLHRGRSGFVHSFAPHYYGQKHFEYNLITVTGDPS